MKTKTINGIKFHIYPNTKIDGNFIHPDKAVYFTHDIIITGNLEAKYIKCDGAIEVLGDYIILGNIKLSRVANMLMINKKLIDIK